MNDANSFLLGGHVIVRAASLLAWIPWLQSHEVTLNQEDAARAERFRFAEDRQRFVLGRVLLARALEENGGKCFSPVELKWTERGRPMLTNDPDLEFSLTHSGNWIGIALTLKILVGIDFEAVSRAISLPELAKRVFSKSDLDAFKKIDPSAQTEAFFRAWTGKEAYLKARGLGLSAGLEDVRIPFANPTPSGLQTFQPEKNGAAWMMQSLPLSPGYIGCVVWNDPAKSVHFRVVDPATDG